MKNEKEIHLYFLIDGKICWHQENGGDILVRAPLSHAKSLIRVLTKKCQAIEYKPD